MQIAQRITDLAESATLAVSAKAARLRADGIDVIGFGAGQPDFPTPSHIVQAGIGALEAGHTGYANPASGLLLAKKAVCTKLARDNALTYAPDQVIITSGGKMACYLAIHAVVNPGDEVIIPKPYWVSYPEIVKLAGGTPVYVTGPEENDFKVSPELLARVVTNRTRLVVLNSPSNPSGVTYTPPEIRGLAQVLQHQNLCVLSDEIYDQLVFAGHEVLSYAAVNEHTYAQTITLNSASKTYAMTGWRLGYAAGPVEMIKAMAKLQSQSTSGAVTFNQHALAEALLEREILDSSEIEAVMQGKILKPLKKPVPPTYSGNGAKEPEADATPDAQADSETTPESPDTTGSADGTQDTPTAPDTAGPDDGAQQQDTPTATETDAPRD
ncbi:MAG: aminotransferase class I/II-fold pyridoxal phosphate-dependent enzyme [Planctomycetes bacterium]|nr:aminotransferase class I/II-fold pyridoxal phosphate-dependent enzyme [Planctomycetota bacterium]